MEEVLRKAVQEALVELGANDTSFVIEWPADLEHGDFSTNAAMAGAKALGKNPKVLAEEITEILRKTLGEQVKSIDVAGPGFINFTLAHPVVTGMVAEIPVLATEWGKGISHDGKRVMIEYTDPNPFKEMHIGHLMSNVIGEATARLIENDGAHISRACYQGDVGPHVAKALWGLQQKGITEPVTAKELGDAYAHGSTSYEKSEEVKGEIDALNTAIYEGSNRELMELWRKGRDVSLAAFEDIYRTLGTKFDFNFFESETSVPGMEKVKEGTTKGVFTESQGAVIYEGEKKGLHTLVFVTSKGNPTYEAKEIGLAYLKEERWPSDESIIITASEQIGHFRVYLAALEDLAPVLAHKTRHVPHGFLRLPTGKMSSREGSVITAEHLIKEVIEKAQEKNEDPLVAQQVAIAAIKYMILRSAPGGDIIFDAEKSLALDGDSGPYLQYALVRAKSLIAQATESAGGSSTPTEPYTLERLLIRFPEVAVVAVKENAPHKVTQYLTQLAGEWNSFYGQGKILGGEEEKYKLQIARAFVTTMENGLKLLGIPTPERM